MRLRSLDNHQRRAGDLVPVRLDDGSVAPDNARNAVAHHELTATVLLFFGWLGLQPHKRLKERVVGHA